MTKTDFDREMRTIFKELGFLVKNRHFYKDVTDDIMIVFGLQSTVYGGGYSYLNYGYCFKSINKHMPYPKYGCFNIDCRRIGPNEISDVFVYDELDTFDFEGFSLILKKVVFDMESIALKGTDELAKTVIDSNRRWLICGSDTATYLCRPWDDFIGHRIGC